ncbi:MAG: DNA-binding protein [Actinomycetia bacterium]|nr:DNA-binding protein [Actinomycetes bacterium]
MADVEDDSDEVEGGELGWMSTKAAAAHLGITTRTLYRFIDEGAVPAYKFGRVIRMKRGDLDVFIENSRVEPGTLSNLYPPRKA